MGTSFLISRPLEYSHRNPYLRRSPSPIICPHPFVLNSHTPFRFLSFYAVGLGALMVDLFLIATRSPAVLNSFTNTLEPLYYVLLASGGAVGILGTFIQQGANPYLSDAVRNYNRAVFDEARGKVSLGVGAVHRGVAAFVRANF